MTGAMTDPGARKSSLVDVAEAALRDWLAPGRHRPGDRLPPEHELAAMLGVSRGTLRVALERLAGNGEIVRRQGSGTYVGRVASPAAFSEGLEVLESYASLARRQGRRLTVRDLEIERERVPGYIAEALGIARGTRATMIRRTLLADGEPAAYMRDIVHPSVTLPDPDALSAEIERGQMMLDVLLDVGVPIAFARTTVRPRLLEPGEEIGDALGVARITAALELMETIHVNDGDAVQYSVDVFPPGSVDVHVIRGLQASGPVAVSPRA